MKRRVTKHGIKYGEGSMETDNYRMVSALPADDVGNCNSLSAANVEFHRTAFAGNHSEDEAATAAFEVHPQSITCKQTK